MQRGCTQYLGKRIKMYLHPLFNLIRSREKRRSLKTKKYIYSQKGLIWQKIAKIVINSLNNQKYIPDPYEAYQRDT